MSNSRNSTPGPRRAMVLAAGLGTRMRAFNGHVPKPLIRVAGKALIDYVLDRLVEQGVECAVVNVHHLADQIEGHIASRTRPKIVISDERSELLGTAGGVIKALPQLGDGPFFHVNSDTIWIDGVKPNLRRLASAFGPAHMDGLLLLAATTASIGYAGRGDFSMTPDGRLVPRREAEIVPFVYAGAAILTPAFFAGATHGPASLPSFFLRSANAGRLFGVRLEGLWMHVGTPEAVKAAEATIIASAA